MVTIFQNNAKWHQALFINQHATEKKILLVKKMKEVYAMGNEKYFTANIPMQLKNNNLLIFFIHSLVWNVPSHFNLWCAQPAPLLLLNHSLF